MTAASWLSLWSRAFSAAAAVLLVIGSHATGQALEVVLNDVAPDRVEKQRRYTRGELPLSGTPDLSKLDERLQAAGLAKGRAIYVRIFKAESELELWMQNGSGTFTRLAVYPICHWTGTIGPKLKEGDKQSPEGFYSVGIQQTRLVGRWRRAFNVGYPNLHDQLLNRTGSYILIHGGCSSTGCFAMTDPVQEEIYDLAIAALASGQERFQVHIFPFRMTEANLIQHAAHDWAHTWADLKPAYDSFERTNIPPRVVLCGVRYKVADGLVGETGGSDRRLTVLKPPAGERSANDAAVLDTDGNWLEPLCQLEDEARRKPASTMMATSSLPTSPAHSVPPAPIASREPNAEANARSPAASAAVAEPVLGHSPRGRNVTRAQTSPRPIRRPSDAEENQTTTSLGEGFGSATFRAQRRGADKVTSHGG